MRRRMCYIEEICLLTYYGTCCCFEIFDCCVRASIARQFHYHMREQERPLPSHAPKERNPFKDPTIPRDEHIQCAYS